MNNSSEPHRDLPLLLAIAIVSFGVGAFLIFFAFTDRGNAPAKLPPFNGLAAELAFSEPDSDQDQAPDFNRDPHSHAEEFRFHRGEEYITAILTLRFEAAKTETHTDFDFFLYPPWPSPPFRHSTFHTFNPGATGDTIIHGLRMPDGWNTGLWKVEVFAEDVWIAGNIFYTD